nr:MAG TPA: hypothetical protein [Caudoviricetes sp.]
MATILPSLCHRPARATALSHVPVDSAAHEPVA